MGEQPNDKCGYTYPEDYEDGDYPNHQSCCYRDSVPDADRCAWHVEPDATEQKTIQALQNARSDAETRNQTSPVGELLDGAVLAGIELYDSISFHQVSLRNADLTDADLKGADLTDADFAKANLTDVNLGDADLTNAEIWSADLTDAELFKTDLTDADLRFADLTNANLGDADLTNANLWDADLTNANFRGADLTNAYLCHADLANAKIITSDLTDASLGDADLTDAKLWSADLTGADLQDADLTDADLRDADLRGTAINHTEYGKITIDEATRFGGKSQFEKSVDVASSDAILFRWKLSFLRAIGRPQTDPVPLERAERQYRAIQRKLRENNYRELVELDIREKHARRKRALAERDYLQWLKLAFYRWPLGYGERIQNVIATAALLIIGFGLAYPYVGGVKMEQEDHPIFSFGDVSILSMGLPGWIETLWVNMYFSIISFSTLGYGDIQPANHLVQALASLQSLVGALLIAYLVFVLGRRTTQ